MLNLISWNVNGIRSLEAPIKDVLDGFEADIICLQETKITRDQLDERTAVVDGYNCYFSFSKRRSGYSGVVTFCKKDACPLAAEEGLSGTFVKPATSDIVGCYGSVHEMGHDVLQSLDCEGRTVLTKHKVRLKDDTEVFIVIINVYCPRSDPEKPERKQFKLKFYELLQRRAEAILLSGCHVIILGDVNTSHKEIDHCDPSQCEEFCNQPERIWLDNFLLNENCEEDPSKKFIDSFRFFHPLQRNAFTCWCTVTGARQTNYGTRIDYIFADTKLCKEAMMESTILVDIKGSDHCPVKGVFDAVCLPSRKPPSLCSTYWPEFSGKQVKVSDYFHRGPTLLKAKLTSLSESTQNHTMTKRSIPQNDTQKYKRITSSQKRITTFMNLNSESRKPEGCLSNGCGVSFTDSSSETFDSYKNTEDVVELSTLQQSEVKRSESAIAWKMLLKGPKPPPLCKGHNEPCVLRIVKKPGQNFGREFYVCARPGGHDKDPAARCNHFQWLK